MTAKEIGKAIQCFIAERGQPEMVISDNAQQFKSLKKIYEDAIRTHVQQYSPYTAWHFIPARAPWWGGFYEGMIRPFKETLRSMIPSMRIRDLIQAHRIVKMAESCMNHRPLWATTDANGDIIVVTPFQFLSVGVRQDMPYPSNDTDLEVLQKLQTAQAVQVRNLWHQVRRTYLIELQAFHNKRVPVKERVVKVGDLVLLKDDWHARNYWSIGRITETMIGYNGKIRTVMLEKYVPNEINKSLALSKYGIRGESKLTKAQRRELTGYFKGLSEPQAVKNLVPFELWQGKKFEHPEEGIVRQFGPNEWNLNHKSSFNNFSEPCSEFENNQYRHYEKMNEEICEEAKMLHFLDGDMFDREYDNAKISRIRSKIGI
jgi:signal peptidase I